MKANLIGALAHRARRVVHHLFQVEHDLGELRPGAARRSLAAGLALMAPAVLHTAMAGNDVMALLGVIGLSGESRVAFLLEAAFTAAVWVGHLFGSGE
jgi:hypothetical protein